MQGIDQNHLMQNARSLQLLGIARRAGKLLFGESACLQAVRDHSARLMIMDAQASENTEKRFANACKHHNVMLWRFDRGNMDVARAVGRERNKTIALTDQGFCKKLLQLEVEAAMLSGNPVRERQAASMDSQGVEV